MGHLEYTDPRFNELADRLFPSNHEKRLKIVEYPINIGFLEIYTNSEKDLQHFEDKIRAAEEAVKKAKIALSFFRLVKQCNVDICEVEDN
jgi:hypothetical protein